jgi:hypothetical protein
VTVGEEIFKGNLFIALISSLLYLYMHTCVIYEEAFQQLFHFRITGNATAKGLRR